MDVALPVTESSRIAFRCVRDASASHIAMLTDWDRRAFEVGSRKTRFWSESVSSRPFVYVQLYIQ